MFREPSCRPLTMREFSNFKEYLALHDRAENRTQTVTNGMLIRHVLLNKGMGQKHLTCPRLEVFAMTAVKPGAIRSSAWCLTGILGLMLAFPAPSFAQDRGRDRREESRGQGRDRDSRTDQDRDRGR